MSRAAAGLFIILALFPSRIAGQDRTTSDRYRRKLEPILRDVIQRQALPGLAVAVIEDGRVVYAAGFGRLRGPKSPKITVRSVFHMASITKPFVATAVMQLVENGKIRLDEPVIGYLPQFRLADERYKAITVRQVLSHCSGIPDVDDYEWNRPQYDEGALDRYVRSLNAVKLDFPPGERFQYSNMAYEILGDLVAQVSGQSFEAYVEGHILAPLKMRDSTLLVTQVPSRLLAWGHELDESGNPVASSIYPYNRIHSPSSNLHASVLDMTRWVAANLNRGELNGGRILRSSTYDVMWTPSAEFDGKPSPVGISWFVGQYRGDLLVSHNGGDTGFMTGLAMLPGKKIGVVWMTNADWLPNSEGVTHAALDTALGLEPQPITGKRSIRQAMLSAYQRGGIDSALRQFEILKAKRRDAYDFGEDSLSNVGWYLLHFNHVPDAIRVFQLSTTEYPESADAHCALATAYQKNGDRSSAIKSYEKALQLAPGKREAADALKELRQ